MQAVSGNWTEARSIAEWNHQQLKLKDELKECKGVGRARDKERWRSDSGNQA